MNDIFAPRVRSDCVNGSLSVGKSMSCVYELATIVAKARGARSPKQRSRRSTCSPRNMRDGRPNPQCICCGPLKPPGGRQAASLQLRTGEPPCAESRATRARPFSIYFKKNFCSNNSLDPQVLKKVSGGESSRAAAGAARPAPLAGVASSSPTASEPACRSG